MLQPQEVMVKIERGQYAARIDATGIELGELDRSDDRMFCCKRMLNLEDAITVAKAVLAFAATEAAQEKLAALAEERAEQRKVELAEELAEMKRERDLGEYHDMLDDLFYERCERDEDW